MTASIPPGFDSWAALLAAYEKEPDIAKYVRHNLNNWRWIHGGLALVRKSPLEFEPITEYWHRTERRVLTSYFAHRFSESYCPAEALRRLAFQVFRHFDEAHEAGRFGAPTLATEENWPGLCDQLVEVAAELPDLPEYRKLAEVWGRYRLGSIGADLDEFLSKHREAATPDDFAPSFYKRLPWFPYLGLSSLDLLYERQRFFFGFYQLFTATNSYVVGGAIGFAPVLQNNPLQDLISFVERWATGEPPTTTGFKVQGRSEKRDRGLHAPVVELFGFLNLHQQPFYNKRNAEAYEASFPKGSQDRFEGLAAIGQRTRSFLEAEPKVADQLAHAFHTGLDLQLDETRLFMEGIGRTTVASRYPKEVEQLAERRLEKELTEAARQRAADFSSLDAATAMAHLILDAGIYERGLEPARGDGDGVELGDDKPPKLTTEALQLPPSLRRNANDALGYLRAGYHVLFAGPPGTGKTTVAQLVGHAWNRGLSEVRERMPTSEAPITTVGNSAWAPFHTIGGILPKGPGVFGVQKGIFIAERAGNTVKGEDTEWQLRPEAIVLDEMNRADLDRCIGELYPLLSGSVQQVSPAGIPGVRTIRCDPKFRIIATVNDATLDDVVFPISEGLARRFVRLELHGARVEELKPFLEAPAAETKEREHAAFAALEQLFELLKEHDYLEETELGIHLPFGVGYFATLRSWVRGDLRLSIEFSEQDPKDQAVQLILTGLRAGSQQRGLAEVLRKLGTTQAPE